LGRTAPAALGALHPCYNPAHNNLTEIVKQLEAERRRIDAAIKTLQGVGGVSAKRGKRRTIGAAGRRRIPAAQRARWAKARRAGK
jgi:hypothetical protein